MDHIRHGYTEVFGDYCVGSGMGRYSFPLQVLVSIALVLALLASVLPVRALPNFIMFSTIPPAVDTAHSASANITVTATGGFIGTVALTEEHSSGLSCDSINPSTVTVTGSAQASLSCHSSARGLYNVTVTGTSGSIRQSTGYQVNVNASASSPPPSPKPGTILGLSPLLFYGFLGTTVTIISASGYFGLRRRKPRAKRQATAS